MKTVVLACDIYDNHHSKQSQEWESEESIRIMENTIQGLGYDVVVLSDAKEIASVLAGIPRKNRENWIVWNLIEGYFSSSRESYIPALCEFLGIPHTGSAASVQSLTLDKYKTKLFLKSQGVPTSEATLIKQETDVPDFPFPIFVKPNGEGSSLGISDENVIQNQEEWSRIVPILLTDYSPLLVEPYLTGKEITVGVMKIQNQYQVLPIAYVETPSGVYHEGIKSKSEFLESLNFDVERHLIEEISKHSIRIAELLEVSGYLRIDYKLEKSKPFFLEANATPGFSKIYSTLPMLWEKSGKSYKELLQFCLDSGFSEYQNHKRFQYGKDQYK